MNDLLENDSLGQKMALQEQREAIRSKIKSGKIKSKPCNKDKTIFDQGKIVKLSNQPVSDEKDWSRIEIANLENR